MNGEFKVKTLYVILTTMAIIAAPIIYVSNIKADISEAKEILSEKINTNKNTANINTANIEFMREDITEIKGDVKSILKSLKI